MRELKFRAWFNRFNKMVYEVDKDFLNLWKGYWDNQIHIVYPDDGDVIEQYTGLKDKNGKEIYEGDILGGIYEHGYIAYCDKCKQLQFFDADMGCMMCSGDIYWRDIVESERDGELEVVGNIHESPELLGGEECEN